VGLGPSSTAPFRPLPGLPPCLSPVVDTFFWLFADSRRPEWGPGDFSLGPPPPPPTSYSERGKPFCLLGLSFRERGIFSFPLACLAFCCTPWPIISFHGGGGPGRQNQGFNLTGAFQHQVLLWMIFIFPAWQTRAFGSYFSVYNTKVAILTLAWDIQHAALLTSFCSWKTRAGFLAAGNPYPSETKKKSPQKGGGHGANGAKLKLMIYVFGIYLCPFWQKGLAPRALFGDSSLRGGGGRVDLNACL